METKFTKGIWTIDADERYPLTISINGHDHFCLPIVSNVGENEEWAGTGIAVLVWPIEDDSPEVRKAQIANAYLIIAAPKMHKALEETREAYLQQLKQAARQAFPHHSADVFKDWQRNDKTLPIINTALAEARGKQ